MTGITSEQRRMIIEGAKKISEALNISEREVFAALETQGNIDSDEEFALSISYTEKNETKILTNFVSMEASFINNPDPDLDAQPIVTVRFAFGDWKGRDDFIKNFSVPF